MTAKFSPMDPEKSIMSLLKKSNLKLEDWKVNASKWCLCILLVTYFVHVISVYDIINVTVMSTCLIVGLVMIRSLKTSGHDQTYYERCRHKINRRIILMHNGME